MKTVPLVSIGIKGSVVALNCATAKQVCAVHVKGSDFVGARRRLPPASARSRLNGNERCHPSRHYR